MFFPDHPVVPLRRGDRGNDVELLQAALNVVFAKYPVYEFLAEDGSFGDETVNAVRRFQQHVGLDDDGIVGRYTWISVFAIANIIAEP